MNCPVCKDVPLVMADRQGIEIDYCPQCRGVWLDRGELDKLIERSAAAVQPQAPARPAPTQEPYRGQEGYRQYPDDQRYRDDYRRKKRKGFLGDLFDFD